MSDLFDVPSGCYINLTSLNIEPTLYFAGCKINCFTFQNFKFKMIVCSSIDLYWESPISLRFQCFFLLSVPLVDFMDIHVNVVGGWGRGVKTKLAPTPVQE